MMKYELTRVALLVSAVALMATPVAAQVSLRGTPYSFIHEVSTSIHTVTLPPVDIQVLLDREAREWPKDRPHPFRYGTSRTVQYGLQNSGTWESLPGGARLWRLKIRSVSSFSIDLGYSDFFMPEGAYFYVYDPAHTKVYGAFTAINNKSNGRFATSPVPGDEVILEYYEPRTASGAGQITVDRVVHAYKDVFARVEHAPYSGAASKAASCTHPGVSCSGTAWEADVRRSVVHINLGSGTTCSGALINNTGTLKDYVLTAAHCAPSTTDPDDTLDWMFTFNDDPCGFEGRAHQALVISKMDSFEDNDHMLLELNEPIRPIYNVFYAGWDRQGNLPTYAVGIHHPAGLTKKKAIDDDPSEDQIYASSDDYILTVGWDSGFHEPGSSGSPLFDQNKRIVGQSKEHGQGGPTNACNVKLVHFFGDLSYAWDTETTSTRRLKDWLDPENTGQTTLDGTDPPAPQSPDPPTNLTVTGSVGQHPNLTWKDSFYATSYDIYRCSGTGAPCTPSQYVTTTQDSFYTDVNKTIGDECGTGAQEPDDVTMYHVVATNVTGDSDPSSPAGTCTDPSKNGFAGSAVVPTVFKLHGNYPNPFNPATEIQFDLPEKTRVQISIFDATGREVTTLVDRVLDGGYRRVAWDASSTPSGVYFYRIQAGAASETHAMVLSK